MEELLKVIVLFLFYLAMLATLGLIVKVIQVWDDLEKFIKKRVLKRR